MQIEPYLVQWDIIMEKQSKNTKVEKKRPFLNFLFSNLEMKGKKAISSL
ncbi:unknown protein [Parachlamydia acanthamoebae UV-7]|jgi:hypothetical protein|uniref:Uncharacterized protein n=2 Tax=Parachlamydia acanthamoebae TaxID=83552 RepID=F8KXX3_PARAV|nr:hypothetical protein DB43_DT00090 [Parachlamydia acanthamoebae]CCB85703.1 unknown protein [Parachlamydia acanthamoebae UV-7]